MYQLLGTKYKWWYLIKCHIKSRTAYAGATFLFVFSQMVAFMVTVLVWSFSDRPDNSDILTYLLLGNIFFALTGSGATWEWRDDIYFGRITSKLIRPANILWYYFIDGIAGTVYYAFSTLIIVIPLCFLFPQNAPFSWNLLWLIPFFFLAYTIRYFLQTIFGLSTFWVIESYGIIFAFETILPVLAGSLIPLYIFEKSIPFLTLLPFAFTFHHPMFAAFGKYSFQESVIILSGGILWCLVLYGITKIILHFGLKRNESVGL